MAFLTARSKTPKKSRSKTPKNSRSKTRKKSHSKNPRVKSYIKHKQQLEQIIKNLIETAKKENKQIDLNPFGKNTILDNRLKYHLKTNKDSKLRLVDLRLLAATIIDEERQKHDCFLHGYYNKYNKVGPKKIIHPILTVDDEDADFNDETLVADDFLSDDRTVCGESKDKLKCLKKGEMKAKRNAYLIKRANRYQANLANLNKPSEMPGSQKQRMKRFIEQVKTKSKPMPPKDCGKTIGSKKQYLVGRKRPIKIDTMSPVRTTSKSLTPTPPPKQPKTTPQPTPSNTEGSPKSVMTPPLQPTPSNTEGSPKSVMTPPFQPTPSTSNPSKTQKSKTGGAKYKSKTRKKKYRSKPRKKRR